MALLTCSVLLLLLCEPLYQASASSTAAPATARFRIRHIRSPAGTSGYARPRRKALEGRGQSASSSATESRSGLQDGAYGSSDVAQAPSTSATASTAYKSWPGISTKAGPVAYHGGRLLTQRIPVHVIFYGRWPAKSGQTVVGGFLRSLTNPNAYNGKNPSVYNWWRLTTQYKDAKGRAVAPQVVVGKALVTRNYYKHLNDGVNGGQSTIERILTGLVRQKRLPLDTNAVYAFVTSSDVTVGGAQDGFCKPYGYCAFHTQFNISGVPIQYIFTGDSTKQCNAACGQNAGLSKTPNGFYGVDSLVSSLAHELSEAATNPDTVSGYWAQDQDPANSWENADLCAGKFTDAAHPNAFSDAQGTYAYNMFGAHGLKFLIQTNVDIKTQECALQYSASSARKTASAAAALATPAPAPSDFSFSPESLDAPAPSTGLGAAPELSAPSLDPPETSPTVLRPPAGAPIAGSPSTDVPSAASPSAADIPFAGSPSTVESPSTAGAPSPDTSTPANPPSPPPGSGCGDGDGHDHGPGEDGRGSDHDHGGSWGGGWGGSNRRRH